MFSTLFRLVTCVTLLLTASLATAAPTKPVNYTGSFELRAPTWNSRSGYIDTFQAAEFAGNLKVNNLFGNFPLSVFIAGEHTIGQAKNTDYFPLENKLKAGIEYPLGKDVTFFSYWDRRFNIDLDRVFVGIRLGFSGSE